MLSPVQCLGKLNPWPGADVVFPCPEIEVPAGYPEDHDCRGIRGSCAYLFQPGKCGIELFADIHIFHEFDSACNAEDCAHIRGYARLMESYFNIGIRHKLGYKWFYQGGIEVYSAFVRKPRGHGAHVGLFALHCCKETVGGFLHKLNAIFKDHINCLQIINFNTRE
jgi:hypothetical protein